ncbi:MAG: hypothetical protein K5756_06915 [Clostridiales bacterium]|nr:hypothetical protein [Clostridiales bacterium]
MSNASEKKGLGKIGLFIYVIIAGIITTVPLRVYQILNITEPETGFYTGKNFTITIMYALIGICFVLPFAYGLKNKKMITFSDTSGLRIFEGVAAFIFAAALIYDVVSSYNVFISLYENFAPTSEMPTMSTYLNKSGAMASLAQAIFALLSAMYFAIIGMYDIKDKKGISKIKLPALSPLVWCIARIIHRFMRKISYMKVGDLFFELMMLAVLALFLLPLAQKFADVDGKGKEWKVAAYGVPAVVFCLICFLPRVIVTVIGKSDMLLSSSPIEFCDGAAALFAIAVLLGRIGISSSENK